MKFAIIAGTNRPGSQTLRVARYVESVMKTQLDTKDSLSFLDLQDLPAEIFRPSSYAEKPESFAQFIKPFLEAQALFFVIPEYNGGAPGVFKYFIDMLPFPESIQRRPTTLVGVAAGRFGNLRGLEQMEGILKYRNAYLYPERTFIPGVDKAVDENGKPKDETTLKVLNNQISGFVNFARRFA